MVLRSVREMVVGLVGCHMDKEDRGEVGGLQAEVSVGVEAGHRAAGHHRKVHLG